MTIGHRILLLIFVASAVIVGFAGVTIWGRVAALRDSGALVSNENAIAAVDVIVSALQLERGRSAQFLGSSASGLPEELKKQRAETDAALVALRNLTAGGEAADHVLHGSWKTPVLIPNRSGDSLPTPARHGVVLLARRSRSSRNSTRDR
jgi:Nitrate and nitrite sensing